MPQSGIDVHNKQTPHGGDGREGGGSWVSHGVESGASHVPQALPTLSSHDQWFDKSLVFPNRLSLWETCLIFQ
jgi:hypothetical protein